MKRIVGGSPETRVPIAAWIAGRVPEFGAPDDPTMYEALAIWDGARIVGAVAYTNYRQALRSVEMTCAGEPGWLTRGAIREFFAYPFRELDCYRITSLVRRDNKPARSFNERLGFKQEGVIRAGFGPRRDMIVFGMLHSDCRWL